MPTLITYLNKNIKKTWSVNKKIVVVFGFLLVFNVFYADAATAKTQRTIIDYEENLKTCDKIAKDFERGATFQQEKQKYGDTLALCYAGYIKIFNICLKGGNQRDYCNCYADEITQELKPLDEYYVECAIQGVEIDKAKQAQINKKIPSGDQIIKKAEKICHAFVQERNLWKHVYDNCVQQFMLYAGYNRIELDAVLHDKGLQICISLSNCLVDTIPEKEIDSQKSINKYWAKCFKKDEKWIHSMLMHYPTLKIECDTYNGCLLAM